MESTQEDDRQPRALMLIENQGIPTDRRVMSEAQSLRAHGYSVSIICPRQDGQMSEEVIDGILVRRYAARPAQGGAKSQVVEYGNALVKTLWHMIALSRRPGFDVIHVGNPPDLFVLLAAPFKLAGKRFIFDQHDLAPELYSAIYARDSGFLMRALRWTERLSYRHSDAVISTNESYKRLACTRGGVDPERVFVVRNGPREGWPGAATPDNSLKRGRPYLVVYLGIMGPQDGVDVLVDSIAELVNGMGFKDATFALVGDGAACPSLREQAETAGIADWIDFTGWISDQELLSTYLVTADACVCPDPSSPLNDKSTFVKVAEYMAAGTPIVAFDLPETRFSAGDAALYAQPGDVSGFAGLIRDALVDETLRERMARGAAERVPMLCWEEQVPNLLAAYECALRQS